ncbi:L-aspartate oxidase [Geomicrobium sp. JCM 19037]|uniref:L-aspartate oxidase n=1 Tax=Geomicrobium sp. JCM 19037 TaxID=1460634 RepID=UPI00045F2459|nr:FAD-binding protein [Geomicrobium sp. JCM 19037]GAK05560.1 L-aspartate oxidase [Geomicrobium sp. JCM 19037]
MAALQLSETEDVVLISKTEATVSNSTRAQGGMAAAVTANDDTLTHATDTMQAGYGHGNATYIQMMTRSAPKIARTLKNLGVPFAPTLGHEGAHSKRRILHANGDQTGQAITTTLLQHVKNRVSLYEHETVVELVTEKGQITAVHTTKQRFEHPKAVILATGGAGQLYARTSNVATATGDGIALAYRAGASVADLEFVQFHPTMLEAPGGGLISEAVRGEGAMLVNSDGERILRNDLASRDVVARAIHRSDTPVFLDARHVKNFTKRFPAITHHCLTSGYDPTVDPLPVAPAAHFMCGGVQTNAWGQTNIERLYAIGEVACTSVHGANRLASNSLLEALVFAEKTSAHIASGKEWRKRSSFSSSPPVHHRLPDRAELQQKMSASVGVERHQDDLNEMQAYLKNFESLPADNTTCSEDDHLFTVAKLVTTAAQLRHETRGAHIRTDFPHPDPKWQGKQITFQLKEENDEQTAARRTVTPLLT